MNRAYYDWPALLVILGLLWWVAYQFSRRTYRLAVGVVAAAGVLAVTGYGLRLPGKHPTFARGLLAGGNAIARDMLGWFIPPGLRHTVLLGPMGWLLLLILIGSVLVAFDTLSTRRQQPTVSVGTVPPDGGGSGGGNAGDGDGDAGGSGSASGGSSGGDSRAVQSRRVITEELKFRLPAVAVRSPASMPGGSTLASLATVVSDSGLQGSKLTAALMQAVHALEARPRVYEVQIFVDHCTDDGKVDPNGPKVLVTVDVRDARNGQTLATRILSPCAEDEAAERVAGFTARQLFRNDRSTPAWATGSYDGDDLSAYLLAQEMKPANRTYDAIAKARQRQREKLASAVSRSTNAGLVQYELASLDDLDGRTVDALRLHLDNRVHNPRFLPARYRLAVSLAALAGAIQEKWPADPAGARRHATPAGRALPAGQADTPARIREDLAHNLAWSGLLRTIRGRQFRDLHLAHQAGRGAGARTRALSGLLQTAHPTTVEFRRISRVLLMLACRELRAYRRRMRASWLLWGALIHRQERAAYLELLRSGPNWRLHPRRRLATPRVALAGMELALRIMTPPHQTQHEIAAARSRTVRQLGLDRVLDGGRKWVYGRLPWQAVYNAACLYAMTTGPDAKPSPAAASKAVTLLRLAIADPDCELDRPSEWIGADPSLAALYGKPEPGRKTVFDAFVYEQAHRDFDPAPVNHCRDPWFQALLPVTSPEHGRHRDRGRQVRRLEPAPQPATQPQSATQLSAGAGREPGRLAAVWQRIRAFGSRPGH
jgi:hypothetical protein